MPTSTSPTRSSTRRQNWPNEQVLVGLALSHLPGTVGQVSLTSRLRRRDDPLRVFFEDRLPNLAPMHQAVKDAGEVMLLPSEPVPYGTVGTALDYRIRYYFAVTPPEDLAAARGAAVFEASLGNGDSRPGASGASCFDRFAAPLGELVDRVEPVGRRLVVDDEIALCRHCYVLALFEEWWRAAACQGSPLIGLGAGADAEAFLGLAGPAASEDLTRLSWVFFDTQEELLAGPSELDPTLSGSRDVGGADADLIVGSTLIDIKSTMLRRLRRQDLYQLVGYTLLDYEDAYGVDEVAFYLARRPALVRWRLDDLLEEMAGDVVDPAELRADLRTLLRDSR